MNNLVRLEKDFSSRSMSILSQKVRAAIGDKIPGANIWLPDTYELPKDSPGHPVDVVFFGDFFRKFLETGNWTPERYRIWCLGEPTKKFLTKLAYFREGQVSILPRNLLYNVSSGNDIPQLTKDSIEFVYAGRLTSSKRIITMIWSVFHLQQSGADVTLSLYGEFFQEEKFCECPGINPYKDKVLTLISGLPWKIPPKLHGNVGTSEWLKHDPARKPVYYSLSVLPFEDFSVSVAQVQELGWPCILSNWGAHKNIFGPVLKIPLQVFGNIHESAESSEIDGKMIAAYIASKPLPVHQEQEVNFVIPEIVSLSDFDQQRRKFLRQWGMNLQDVIRHRTEDLKDSRKWDEFMKEYTACFL